MAGRFCCVSVAALPGVYSMWVLESGVPLPLHTQRAVGQLARALKGNELFIKRRQKKTQQKHEGEIDSGKQAMRGFGSGPPISDRTQCGRTPGGPPPIDHC